MNYKVAITVGETGTSTQEVSDVSNIQFYEEAYYFYNEANDILFIAPKKSVAFIKKT
ncbi:hypothetical protein MKX53_17510 [Psychrobacillus sp. FSL K6-4615]|uniref:hypothetical protein n=1 Tax=Psychrobacillus sp. FSL K6-4615 TaxID=2921551 RepID=UPI0030F94386